MPVAKRSADQIRSPFGRQHFAASRLEAGQADRRHLQPMFVRPENSVPAASMASEVATVEALTVAMSVAAKDQSTKGGQG
jgi:hypothetical protein